MSQTHVDNVSVTCLVHLLERIRFMNNPVKPDLTPQQRFAVRKAWSYFGKGDNDRAGYEMFMEMFKQKPEMKKHFDFASDTAAKKMQSNSRLLFHVSRVAWNISNVLEHLDDLENVVPTLKQIGGRHNENGYNIPPEHLQNLGDALISCMKREVPNFSDNDAAAWRALYSWIIGRMKEGMKEYK